MLEDLSRDDDRTMSWTSVADMLSQPCWGRTWVIQELASAWIATFYHGSVTLDMSLMLVIVQLLKTCHWPLTRVPAMNFLYRNRPGLFNISHELLGIWYLFQNRCDGISLHHVLRLSRKMSCQDPKDEVFAILGLASDEIKNAFPIDYRQPTAAVYARAIIVYYQHFHDLDVLLDMDSVPEKSEYPSWVVGWNQGHRSKYCSLLSLKFRAGLYDEPLTAAADEHAMVLALDVICVDTVTCHDFQGTTKSFNKDILSSPPTWTWDIDFVIRSLSQDGPLCNAIKGAVYDTITAGHQKPSVKSSAYTRRITQYNNAAAVSLEKIDLSREERKPNDWEDTLNQAVNWTRNRTLILSKQRYSGLAPSHTLPGDSIFAIHGLSIPAILRLKDDGTWTFIGAAYVRGLMDGEAIEYMKKGKYISRRYGFHGEHFY
ncbi:hypothetical protein BJ878DRAFT_568795 [Calycina marina]|uniref:Heterokaryon incompatibility domain-containing protein n=1 Tax=Calycina marina TaxID=1763456 RepID=A0A9P7YZY8_9HELO|nr:hypothetical protein BJ878DRAFT_568795 [Calycina marina]